MVYGTSQKSSELPSVFAIGLLEFLQEALKAFAVSRGFGGVDVGLIQPLSGFWGRVTCNGRGSVFIWLP